MKKIVIVLVIAILVISGLIGFMYLRGKNSNSKDNNNGNNSSVSYGNRGNISQVEKIKFLSKNDEYLVGMIGLPVSKEIKQFTDDDMIRFALNVAVTRYEDMLTTKSNKDGTNSYLISTTVVNSITSEYFGVNQVKFDADKNEYYSKSNKAFLLNELPKVTLYYYPVTMADADSTKFVGQEVGTLLETNTEGDASNSADKEKKYKEITADAIFVSDEKDLDTIEHAKYNGEYSESDVDSSIKFIFNGEGKLVAYQYI